MKFKLLTLITFEFLKRYKVIFTVSLVITLLMLLLQLKFQLFFNPSLISIGLIGTYQEHDLPIEVLRLLSQPLVEADMTGRIKGKLVTGWETNNDATQFKFKLKDNLKWIDNSPIKSQDLAFSVAGLDTTTLDEKTIQFNLKEAYSPLPSLLTKPVLKKGSLMGIGPYKIVRIEKSRIFITKLQLQSPDPALPTVFIRFYPTEKIAITGFNLGEVQVLWGLTSPNLFVDHPQVALKQKTDNLKIVSILFQTKDTRLSNRSLRQALAYISPQIPSAETANNPYPHNHWAYNSEAKKYLSNPKEAKKALERAKAALSSEKLQEELILTATPNLEEVGKKVVNSWQSLGLNAKLRIESGIPQNFQALLITQSIPLDPDQYFLWHATQTKTNLTGYDSKRVDKDLEDGRKIITEDERKEKYFDFQKTLLEDAPAVFLYFPKYNIIYLKKSKKNLVKLDF